MINRRRRAGAVLAAVAAVVAAWLPATSAQAADGPVVHIEMRQDKMALPMPPSEDPPQVSWLLHNDGPGVAKDVTISMDLTDVKSWLTVDGKAADDVYSWSTMAEVPEGDESGYIADINPKPDTPLGTTGTIIMKGTSSNGTVVSTPVELTVGSAELTVNKPANRKNVKPGTTVEDPVTISNTGSVAAQGVQLKVLTTTGISYTEHFSNCAYSTNKPGTTPQYNAPRQALCTFDTVVEPGKAYRLDRSFGLDVQKDALYEVAGRQALPLDGAVPSPGSGPKLSLVPAGDAAKDGVSLIAWQTITADNHADMVAGGDTAKGAPGDLVHVDVSMSDEGPARVGSFQGDTFPVLILTVPTGAKAVEIPDGCSVWSKDAASGTGEKTPGAPQYLCYAEPMEFTVGDTRTYRFGLEVRDNARTTSGTAEVITPYGAPLAFDDNQANNTAPVTVEVEGTDSSATASASASATTASDDGNDVKTQTVADTAADGSLASTGSSSALPVAGAVGAGALLLGGALVFFVRRRKA
ncbi:LPXTG cell wall anchor domain-containing protein [Streptomyces sp. NPDC047072]|uniref:LPXTG cell wall anchor domain-containing protein n=1 Tax=Streptomyces sp. NPDC047072 TaxID=3154809 RepID=UPI0033E42109